RSAHPTHVLHVGRQLVRDCRRKAVRHGRSTGGSEGDGTKRGGGGESIFEILHGQVLLQDDDNEALTSIFLAPCDHQVHLSLLNQSRMLPINSCSAKPK